MKDVGAIQEGDIFCTMHVVDRAVDLYSHILHGKGMDNMTDVIKEFFVNCEELRCKIDKED